jgi:hypothetical protein
MAIVVAVEQQYEAKLNGDETVVLRPVSNRLVQSNDTLPLMLWWVTARVGDGPAGPSDEAGQLAAALGGGQR